MPRARERENDELNLEDSHVHRLDDKLSELIAIGKGQGGWLTFSQVNDYLPDEAVNPEKLDTLLMTIEELGMEIVADKKLPYSPPEKKRGKNGKKGKEGGEEKSRRIDDPVRMYLTQMAEIPLLTREQEISLAKKIEVTRKRFRRPLLGCNFAMQGGDRHAGEGPRRRAAVRPHDQGLAHRAADQGADHRPHAAQPEDARAPAEAEHRRLRKLINRRDAGRRSASRPPQRCPSPPAQDGRRWSRS